MLDEEGSPSGVRKSQRVRKSSKRFSDEYVMDQEKQKKPLKDSPKKTEQETLSASGEASFSSLFVPYHEP